MTGCMIISNHAEVRRGRGLSKVDQELERLLIILFILGAILVFY